MAEKSCSDVFSKHLIAGIDIALADKTQITEDGTLRANMFKQSVLPLAIEVLLSEPCQRAFALLYRACQSRNGFNSTAKLSDVTKEEFEAVPQLLSKLVTSYRCQGIFLNLAGEKYGHADRPIDPKSKALQWFKIFINGVLCRKLLNPNNGNEESIVRVLLTITLIHEIAHVFFAFYVTYNPNHETPSNTRAPGKSKSDSADWLDYWLLGGYLEGVSPLTPQDLERRKQLAQAEQKIKSLEWDKNAAEIQKKKLKKELKKSKQAETQSQINAIDQNYEKIHAEINTLGDRVDTLKDAIRNEEFEMAILGCQNKEGDHCMINDHKGWIASFMGKKYQDLRLTSKKLT